MNDSKWVERESEKERERARERDGERKKRIKENGETNKLHGIINTA
jgi:hypothetical protein